MVASRALTAFVAVAALSLTACGPGDTTPTPLSSATPTPGATPGVTPSPTPTETSTPTPTPSTGGCPVWVDDPDNPLAAIDFNRYVGICVGMSFPEAAVASGMPVIGEASCPWLANITADETLGFYVSAMSNDPDPNSEILFFRMIWQSDPALANSYEMPRTAQGISIGSTEAELLAAYPSAVAVMVDDMSRGPRDERLVSGPDGLTYVFSIIDGYVSEIAWGLNLTSGQNGELCAL